MPEGIEIIQSYEMCNRRITWTAINRCSECVSVEQSSNENDNNATRRNVDANESNNVEVVSSVRNRKISDEIKVKGLVQKKKEQNVTRLFSVNCNGFGTRSNDKIDQIIRESREINIDRVLISWSDTKWGTVNRNIIENKLKTINAKIFINTSDSKEKLNGSKYFLKGGTFTALWNDVVNYAKVDQCVKNEHGWWNGVVLEGNSKILAIITVYRIVDANTKSVNSTKAQCERKTGKVKRAKETRKET